MGWLPFDPPKLPRLENIYLLHVYFDDSLIRYTRKSPCGVRLQWKIEDSKEMAVRDILFFLYLPKDMLMPDKSYELWLIRQREITN